MRKFTLFCAAAAVVAPAAAYAQETTSTITGQVTAAGAPVANAEVVVTHVPSGTVSRVSTDATGSFTATGLRVGGPFTVAVTAPGYSGMQVTDINTVIGEAYRVPVDLQKEGEAAIVVTASRVVGAGNVSQGPATVINAEQIKDIASINRDVRDLERRDPFARLDDTPSGGRAVSFAGQNARFNRFTVDGVPVTDNFGLNPDGLPSRRSPIPLDAIGQFQTRVAPYDVREGNFQGGVINVVLRSGTNHFQGSGFFSYTDDKLTGKRSKDLTVTLPRFKSYDFGAELSGPIIKDKLFFMIAGERIRAGTPIAEGPSDNNAGAPIFNLTQAQVDQVRQIAQSKYNYDPGNVLNNSKDRDDRLVAKLDWNISDSQRASFTYTYTKDSIQFNQSSFVTAPTGLGLESNGYVGTNRLHTGVFNLNSDWSDNFTTEARVFYKDYKRGQDPIMGRGFAQFQICLAPTSDRLVTDPKTGKLVPNTTASASTSCQSGFSQISIGPDISRQSNELNSHTWGGLFQGRYKAGGHDLRAFVEYQDSRIYNLFLQRTAGDYYFDSIADFQAGNAQRLRYQNAIPSLSPSDAAARFGYTSFTTGVQDNWKIGDTLNVSIGARFDMFGGHSQPAANPNFVARYGFPNDYFISGKSLFQPRFGFDWKPTPRLSIRGGGGLFGGGTPDVYVSNSFSTTGILSNSVDIRLNNNGTFLNADTATGNAALFGVTGRGIPALVNTNLLNATVATASPTNALASNFQVPSQWRATLSAEYKANLGPLGDGWRFGADLFYSKVRNQVLFTDIRSVTTGLMTPDGRPRYTSLLGASDNNSDIVLTNTKKGRSYIAVARFEKSWDFGLRIFGSYTWQNIKDQAPATSSTASSNYANGAFVDPNIVAYGRSNDEAKYNIKYGFNYDHAFFGEAKTRIALFGESRIGHPFSYTFLDPSSGRSAIFGTTGSGSRYLLYVPTIGGDAKVSYDSAATQAALEGLINSTDLKKYQGKIAPRNGFHSKAFTKLDLHLEQEIPTFVGGSKVSVFADIENVGNFLNHNWGQIQEYTFPYNVAAVRVQCLVTPVDTGTAPTAAQQVSSPTQACAQYRYSAVSPVTPTIYSRQSLYTIRIGARFTF